MKRLLLAVGLGLALPAAPCWACSCLAAEPAEHAGYADAIFTGVVTRVEERQEPDPEFPEEGPHPILVMTVRAETAYKGAVDPSMEIRTANDSAACGVELTEGMRYTIFAYQNVDDLHTGLCSGTTSGPITPSEYGLSAGTTIAAPHAPVADGVDTDPGRWTWALIAPGAIVVALLLWILVARARRGSS